MKQWHSFLWTADEWLVNYFCVPSGLGSVTLFSIGHALELYLKAAYSKKIGNVDAAVRKGHNLKSIWDSCKTHDSDFMPEYEIRDSVFAANLFSTPGPKLSLDDQRHFLLHQEFYLVMKLLPDLKYLGASMKLLQGPYGIGYLHPNEYWVRFFKRLRRYINHPSEDRLDIIRHLIEDGDLPAVGRTYLEKLYQV